MGRHICIDCSANLAEAARFCAQCGQPVQRADQTRPATETRILTLLFVDIVDSTTHAQSLGLERYDEVLSRFHQAARRTICDFGGSVLQAYGDGLLACFGLHRDSEDAAVAGAAAALGLVAEIGRVLPQVTLRVGVHSGKVICRVERGSQLAPQVTGYDVNLTARLQELAEPGHVVISQTTRSFIEHLADLTFSREGCVRVKGAEHPVAYAQLARLNLRTNRSRKGQLLEREALVERILRSRDNFDRPVGFLVIGPPGIGKSSFCEQICEVFDHRPVTLMARSNLTNTPLFPVLCAVREGLDISLQASFSDLASLPFSAQQKAVLAEALGIADAPAHGFSLNLLKKKRLNVLAETLAYLAARAGNLLVLDDLHWADRQTLQTVAILAQNAKGKGLSLLVTTRPDAKHLAWAEKHGLISLPLPPLSDKAAFTVLSAFSGLSHTQQQAIVARSEGNPLFLLALAEGVDRSQADNPAAELPANIEATLQAAIENLGGLKFLVQRAAILGRHIAPAHLALLTELQGDFSVKFDYLTLSGVFEKHGDGYRFAHILIRDAAYNMLTKKQKKSLHWTLASKLQAEDPEFCQNYPELIADHFQAAEDSEKCAAASVTAGQNFLRRADLDLAIKYLNRATSKSLQGTPVQLEAQTLLASAKVQKLGFAHPAVLESYQVLDQLVSEQDDSPHGRMLALYGLFAHRMIGGQVRTCVGMVERMRSIALDADPTLQILWQVNASALGLYSGDFAQAQAASRAVKALYDAKIHGGVFLEVGADPLASVLSAEVHIHAQRGEPTAARAAMEAAQAHLTQIGATLQRPWIHIFGALALYFSGERAFALNEVAQGIDLADQQTAEFWSLTGRLVQAVFLVFEGDPKSGSPMLGELLPQAEAIGLQLNFPLYRAALAAACLQQDDLQSAVSHAVWARRRVARQGEEKWAPLVWQVEAALCRAQGRPDAARRAEHVAALYSARSGATIWRKFTVPDRLCHNDGNSAREVLVNRNMLLRI